MACQESSLDPHHFNSTQSFVFSISEQRFPQTLKPAAEEGSQELTEVRRISPTAPQHFLHTQDVRGPSDLHLVWTTWSGQEGRELCSPLLGLESAGLNFVLGGSVLIHFLGPPSCPFLVICTLSHDLNLI